MRFLLVLAILGYCGLGHATHFDEKLWKPLYEGNLEQGYERIFRGDCEEFGEEMYCYFLLAYLHYRISVLNSPETSAEVVIEMFEGIDQIVEYRLD